MLSLGLLCEKKDHSCEWKKEESPPLMKDGKFMWCESANHVPIVAASSRTSHFRCPKPREPRPDIGPPITLSRVQALGDESHKVPERLRFFHSRPLTHMMSRWNNLYLSHKGKHLMMRASSEAYDRKVEETEHKQSNWQAQRVKKNLKIPK